MTPEPDPLVKCLVDIVREHPGVDNAIRERELAGLMGISERDVRDVRALAEAEYPIAALPWCGVYWCECFDDYEHALAYDKAMLNASARRFSRRRKTRNLHYPVKQTRLTGFGRVA